MRLVKFVAVSIGETLHMAFKRFRCPWTRSRSVKPIFYHENEGFQGLSGDARREEVFGDVAEAVFHELLGARNHSVRVAVIFPANTSTQSATIGILCEYCARNPLARAAAEVCSGYPNAVP